MFQICYNVSESNLRENLLEIKKTKLKNSNDKKTKEAWKNEEGKEQRCIDCEKRTQIGDSKPAQLPQ